MTKQNVYILNYNLLYEILHEIKENLSFNIIKFENEDSLINNFDLDIKSSLIISRSNNKFVITKNLKNFFSESVNMCFNSMSLNVN